MRVLRLTGFEEASSVWTMTPNADGFVSLINGDAYEANSFLRIVTGSLGGGVYHAKRSFSPGVGIGGLDGLQLMIRARDSALWTAPADEVSPTLLADPGFELGTGWSYLSDPYARRIDVATESGGVAAAHSGVYAGSVTPQALGGFPPVYVPHTIRSEAISVYPGEIISFSIWASGDLAVSSSLDIRLNLGGGMTTLETLTSPSADWLLHDYGRRQTVGTSLQIELNAHSGLGGSIGWLVDDVSLRFPVRRATGLWFMLIDNNDRWMVWDRGAVFHSLRVGVWERVFLPLRLFTVDADFNYNDVRSLYVGFGYPKTTTGLELDDISAVWFNRAGVE